MKIVVKGTRTYTEFQAKKQKIMILAKLAYERHREFVKEWREGHPIKAWFDFDGNICVKYESGVWWHYKDLELPFPTWW